jgi:hypothetical protein
MFSEVVKAKLRKVDVYRQVSTSLTQSTLRGAAVSVVVLACICVLFFAEFSSYLQIVKRSDMYVNIESSSETLTINLDITLHRYPCALVSLDMIDVVGNYAANLQGTLDKQRLSTSGVSLGLYSAEFSPDTAKIGLQAKEGCRLTGRLEVNRVPGRFMMSSYSYNEHLVFITERNINQLTSPTLSTIFHSARTKPLRHSKVSSVKECSVH